MALALLLVACAYEVPLDPDAPVVTNVLEGTVVVNGADQVADTVILLYTADNPPPPVGTGRPVSFATVPASAYTTGAGGVPSAPWALTEVPDGAVLCSHGDLIPDLIRLLTLRGMEITGASGNKKGSIWVLESQNGHFVKAEYLPPR